MESALVIGASGGIGAALSEELETRGYQVTRLSRGLDGLDVTRPETVDQALSGIGPFRVVLVATGKLDGAGQGPEKSLRALGQDAMVDQFRVNAAGPALVLRHLPKLLPRKGDSFCGVLSARVGSIGDNELGGWYSYRAAKAALNQFVHGAAVELARSHPGVRLIALHPGTVETDFTAGYAAPDKLSPAKSAAALCDVLMSRGADQTGSFWDWKGQEVPW